MVMGDFNAKVGSDKQQVWLEAVGRCGLGEANNGGMQLLQFCEIKDLAISKTYYRPPKKTCNMGIPQWQKYESNRLHPQAKQIKKHG